MKPIEGKRVKRDRSHDYVVDPEGWALLTASSGYGGLRTKQHDNIQHAMAYWCGKAGIPNNQSFVITPGVARSLASTVGAQWSANVSAELDASDAQLLASGTAFHCLDGENGVLRFSKPDGRVDFGGGNKIPFQMERPPPSGGAVLVDYKTLAGKVYEMQSVFTTPAKDQNEASYPVMTKQRQVPRDYVRKAQEADRVLGVPPGSLGPFEAALATFGETVGLVVGALGECSPNMDSFIRAIAHRSARRILRESGVDTEEGRLFASERAAISLQIGSLTTLGNVKILMEMANRAAGRSFRRDQTKGELLDEWEAMYRCEDAARGRTGHGAGFLVSREQGVGFD